MIIVTKMVTIMLLMIDRIYREVGSARVRERPVIMMIVTKMVTIMLSMTIIMVQIY